MGTYVTLTEDKFGPIQKVVTGDSARSSLKSRLVRRPMHGMDIPEDTYATITIRRANGKELGLLLNTSTKGVSGSTYTTNLIVQRVDENRQEKQQVVETFGEDFVYYYGQRPRVLTVAAILPDSDDFQYAQEFWTNYDRSLRGTRLVTRDARVFLSVAGQVFEGYLSSAQTSRSADQPRIIQLNIQMYVTHSYYIQALKDNKGYHSDQPPYTHTNKGDYLQLPDSISVIGSATDDIFGAKELSASARALLQHQLAVKLKDEFEVYFAIERSTTQAIRWSSYSANNVYYSQSNWREPGSESSISRALSAVGTGLSIAAGGLIVAGAAAAVVDDVRAFDGNFLDYLNARVVQPIVDEALTFLVDLLDIAGGLFEAGYSIVSPDQSVSESSLLSNIAGVSPDQNVSESSFLSNVENGSTNFEPPPAESLLFITESASNVDSNQINDDSDILAYSDSVNERNTNNTNILNEVIGL